MRLRGLSLLVVLAVLLAGCASEDEHAGHDGESAAGHVAEPVWTFTERVGTEEPKSLGRADGFAQDRTLNATGSMRQIGGQWHSALGAEETFALRFEASAPVSVSFRLLDASGATATGTCDWGEAWSAEKDVALGRARMRNNETACDIDFTPGVRLESASGPTLKWEARSREAHADGWSLRFTSSLPPQG